MSALTTRQAAHFEALYASTPDPWHVRDAWYEQRKRTLLLACLPQARYGNAFEPGCGNGELSAALALRCARLLACDGSASAVAAGRARVAGQAHVTIEQRHLPQDWPDDIGAFDLVVVSELAYYFPAEEWQAMMARIVATLAPGGLLLMCHCRHPYDDYLTSADFVHATAHAAPQLNACVHYLESDFLIDGWLRA